MCGIHAQSADWSTSAALMGMAGMLGIRAKLFASQPEQLVYDDFDRFIVCPLISNRLVFQPHKQMRWRFLCLIPLWQVLSNRLSAMASDTSEGPEKREQATEEKSYSPAPHQLLSTGR